MYTLFLILKKYTNSIGITTYLQDVYKIYTILCEDNPDKISREVWFLSFADISNGKFGHWSV